MADVPRFLRIGSPSRAGRDAVEAFRQGLRYALGIQSPSRAWRDAWASAYDRTALGALKRRVADSSSAFVDFMIDVTPGGREETDAETRRIVAKAEAEGAALIGAEPCPADHDFEAQNAVSNVALWACPLCGAAR